MNKKSFALSWGRKMFFGAGWLFTSCVALIYFQSMIIPMSLLGWFYFASTFIGYYGIMIGLLYFVLYGPVIRIFPSYYFSRIWALFLIFSLNALIFFDGYLFSKYRFHLDSFLGQLIAHPNANEFFELTPFKTFFILGVSLFLFLAFWIHGEKLWRKMQTRFSNPVRNWYLVVILCLFSISNYMRISDLRNGTHRYTQLANLVPYHYPFAEENSGQNFSAFNPHIGSQSYKDFYYPQQALKCEMKAQYNIVTILLDEWPSQDFTLESMPFTHHVAGHGLNYTNHLSGEVNEQQSHFAFMYSLPSLYMNSVFNQSKLPVFISQLDKNEMDVAFWGQNQNLPLITLIDGNKEKKIDDINNYLDQRKETQKPFFLHAYLNDIGAQAKDAKIKEIFDQFIKAKLTQQTIFVITGLTSGSDDPKTPLVILWPEHDPEVIDKVTTHYDILPTIMMEDWRCQTPQMHYSFGQNIFSKELLSEYVIGDYKNLKIYYPGEQAYINIENGKLRYAGSVNFKSQLKTLERLGRFFKAP